MNFYKNKEKTLALPIKREDIAFNLFTDEELKAEKGNPLVFDWEFYPNYSCVSFMSYFTEKVIYFEISEDSKLDENKLLWIMTNFCIVGFNSQDFDLPLTWLALVNPNPAVLFEAAQDIINNQDGFGVERMTVARLEQKYNFKCFWCNHIDLIEVAPLTASLKLYGARLHVKRLQELPYKPTKHLTKDEAFKVLQYNINGDLPATLALLKELEPQLDLRVKLKEQYDLDLRSKSDAQIAETVIISEVRKIADKKIIKPEFKAGESFKYEIPSYVKYKMPVLQQALEVIKNTSFIIPSSGKMEIPEAISKIKICIGTTDYKLKIGGLHSSEKSVSHYSDEKYSLFDSDVASFYPRIILNLGLYPKHLGTAFLEAYEKLVNRRLAAKKTDKVMADGLKITVNGGFGKFGNKYSMLYSPHLLIAVTMTGQLSLLMLIEMLELAKILVVSGNTDGIVIKCPNDRINDMNSIIKEWESITRFVMEQAKYKSIHSRDVNNYYAIKYKWDKVNEVWLDEIDFNDKKRYFDEKHGCKVKGCYCERGSALNSVLSKNPTVMICSDAIIAYLTKQTPIEETILSCKDIRRFVSARNVKGGAQKDGCYLGKVVRWYYATGINGNITYVLSGNAVSVTEGAKPLMDLPDSFPMDINYKWYIEEANKYLEQIGVFGAKQIQFW